MAIVRHILDAMVSEYEIWAFGLRVHGRCLKKFYDIDLAIIADAPVDSGRLSALKDAFSESDLPYRVDVVDFASASRTFRDIIQQEHEVIQPRNLSWECVQGVRYGFEGRNGKNRRHLIGDKSFFRIAKRIKSLRHVGSSN